MITTLRGATAFPSSNVTLVGDGGALQDGNDSTGYSHTGGSGVVSYEAHALNPDITLASNQRVLALRNVIRLNGIGRNGGINTHVYFKVGGTDTPSDYYDYNMGGSIGTLTGAWKQSNSSGGEWSQADVNGALTYIRDDGANVQKPFVVDLYVQVDIRHRMTVAALGPVGTNPGSTRSPLAQWNVGDIDGQGQIAYQVKFFRYDQFTAVGFNPDTSTAVYDSGRVAGGANSFVCPVALADNTYRMYVRVAKDFRSGDWWSDWTYSSFSIVDQPSIPTGLTPSSGSTVATDLPTISASFASSGLGTQAYLEFQLATNSGFSSNLRTFDTQADGTYTSGTLGKQVPLASRLFQGTWYLRARSVDISGRTSGWTNTATFSVSHPPAPANLTPTGDQTLNYGSSSGQVDFGWVFTDPAPEGDVQSAYQLIIERTDTSAQVYDSGKVTSTAKTHSYTVSSGLKAVGLRWKLRLWDADDVAGSYSVPQLFKIADPPAVVITTPGLNDAVPTSAPLIAWNQTFDGYIAAFKIQLSEVGQPVGSLYDSGFISQNSSVGAQPTGQYQVPLQVLKNNKQYSLTVTLKDNSNLTGSSTTALFIARWQAPQGPVVGLDLTPYKLQGYVELSWDSSARDPLFVKYNIYQKIDGDDEWELVGSTNQILDEYVFRNYLVGTGIPYHFAVTQVARKFGEEVESFKPDENRVYNPNFDYGLGGWQVSNGSLITDDGLRYVLTTDSSIPTLEPPCVEVVDDSEDSIHNLSQDNTTALGDMSFPVTPGEILVVSCVVKMGDPEDQIGYLQIFDDEPHTIGGTYHLDVDSEVVSDWTYNDFQTVVADGRVQGSIFARPTIGDIESTGTARFDSFSVTHQMAAVTVTSEDYWLVDPTSSLAARLYHVIAESMSDEYEEEEIILIGKGRKMDYGTRLGNSGQLTAQLWDVPADPVNAVPAKSARQQKAELDLLKTMRHTIYLRNPFGDVLAVTPGNITFERLPGVGLREYGTVTIPYKEVVT